MKRGNKVLNRFAILVLFACFMYPSLLYKSITSFTTEEIDSGHLGSAREIRSVEFDATETETTRRMQSETTSASSQNCVKPSIDDFPNDFMTQYQRQKQGGVVIHFLLAIYMFGALALVCDDYFVPSLEQITNKLHMGSDVAGATFMAAGSSAPQLFASLIVRV